MLCMYIIIIIHVLCNYVGNCGADSTTSISTVATDLVTTVTEVNAVTVTDGNHSTGMCYVIVISRARGIYGIYCTEARGQ